MLELNENDFKLDDFIFMFITNKKQSYCPILPIAVQYNNYSDIEHTLSTFFDRDTQHWNKYSPIKLPLEYLNLDYIVNLKTQNEHTNYQPLLKKII
jgi:hypothetical protein